MGISIKKKGDDLKPVGAEEPLPNGSENLVKKAIKKPAKSATADEANDAAVVATTDVANVAPASSGHYPHKVQATVETTHADGSITEVKEDIGTAITTVSKPAEVDVSVGLTRNLGNYESMKFNVRLMVPCDPTAEDIEQTYQQVKGWVDTKASEINQEITDQIG